MNTDQYLTFFIRGEEYAAPILRVKEIIEFERVTRVPAMPAHVRGVINLRGAVLPVVDLASKFGAGELAPSRTTCIIIVETRLGGELLTIGVLADAVSEVLDIAAGDIEPPPPFGTGVRVDFLTGMGKLENRLALILDIDRVLSPVELQQTIDAATEEVVGRRSWVVGEDPGREGPTTGDLRPTTSDQTIETGKSACLPTDI